MFKYILLNGVLAVCPIEPNEVPLDTNTICALSQSERDVIFRQAEWATYRAIGSLEMADEEIAKLTTFNGKKSCQAALQAALCSLAGATSKERIVISAISVIGKYLDSAVDGLWEAYYHLLDAKAYALKADELEQRLWRDE